MALPKNIKDREHQKFDFGNNVKTIDSSHDRIHLGQVFTASYYDATVAKDTELNLLIVQGIVDWYEPNL